jgi:hypothetical protein
MCTTAAGPETPRQLHAARRETGAESLWIRTADTSSDRAGDQRSGQATAKIIRYLRLDHTVTATALAAGRPSPVSLAMQCTYRISGSWRRAISSQRRAGVANGDARKRSVGTTGGHARFDRLGPRRRSASAVPRLALLHSAELPASSTRALLPAQCARGDDCRRYSRRRSFSRGCNPTRPGTSSE